MSVFLLPYVSDKHNIIERIFPTTTHKKKGDIKINKTLSNYLNILKGQIDIHNNEWDKYKKYTNINDKFL